MFYISGIIKNIRTDFLFFILYSLFFIPLAQADDCLIYKLNPGIEIQLPSWTKEVVQPLKPMDFWHGNVVATLVENYEIIGDTTSIEDGFCVSLKSVKGTIGYSDFMVKIDSRHVPESCAYNAVLTHEDEHIRAYLSVIDDYKKDMESSVYGAADSIMPIFVGTESEIDAALDALHQKLLAHPDVVLMKQKIQAEQEIRNKRVDQQDHSDTLKKCMI